MQSEKLLLRIRWALGLLMVGLLLSGVTAFPIERELNWLTAGIPSDAEGVLGWLLRVREGITMMYAHYPWIAYGTDWLAFAHLILAGLFVGPWRDPVRNLWVIEFGLLACLGVLPLALICGPIREIPFYWRLVDCSFGVFGFVPLWLARGWALTLEKSR